MFPILSAALPPVLELTGCGEKVNMLQAGRNTTELNVRSNFTCPVNHLLLRNRQTKIWPTVLIQGFIGGRERDILIMLGIAGILTMLNTCGFSVKGNRKMPKNYFF